MNVSDELGKLQQLHEQGAITDAEYARAKAAVLEDRSSRGGDLLGRAAQMGVRFYIVMSVVGLIGAAVVFLAFFLPRWREADQQRQEFQRQFEARRQQFDRDFRARQQQFDQEWKRREGKHQ